MKRKEKREIDSYKAIIEGKMAIGTIRPYDKLSDIVAIMNDDELETLLASFHEDTDMAGNKRLLLALQIADIEKGANGSFLMKEDDYEKASGMMAMVTGCLMNEKCERKGLLTFLRPVSIFDEGMAVKPDEEKMKQFKQRFTN